MTNIINSYIIKCINEKLDEPLTFLSLSPEVTPKFCTGYRDV